MIKTIKRIPWNKGIKTGIIPPNKGIKTGVHSWNYRGDEAREQMKIEEANRKHKYYLLNKDKALESSRKCKLKNKIIKQNGK